MQEALSLANEAFVAGEVPVGCVIADEEGAIIGRGRNRRNETGDATAHAEIEAIKEACTVKNDWRLEGCSIYVTLEPCPMCAGAIINSRIKNVFFGAAEPNSGSCGTVINLFEENYGHHPAVYKGVSACECSRILKNFFAERRTL